MEPPGKREGELPALRDTFLRQAQQVGRGAVRDRVAIGKDEVGFEAMP
ncbi:MAG: hypothetical protein WDO13_10540 [Verrucomicrobiota bacterium]